MNPNAGFMSGSCAVFGKNRVQQLGKFAQLVSNVMGAVRSSSAEVYKDGALSCEVKRLIALTLALGAGCRNCILAQTKNALDNGATKEVILEALSLKIRRNELYARVWVVPIWPWKKYGLSDTGLAKICKKNDDPRL